MKHKKILVCGDSFSADWSKKTGRRGWINMICGDYSVTNLSQAGCGEYKIYRQLKSQDLDLFECIILSHTSPYRIHVNTHPLHKGDPLHNNCDLIYEDLKSHKGRSLEINFFVDFFEKYYDLEHAVYLHSLICRDIELGLDKYHGKVIHMRNISWNGLHEFPDMIDNSDVFESHRGDTNHFDDVGNRIVYDRVKARIER